MVEAERDDVVRHCTNFVMHNYHVGPADVTLNFGSAYAFRNRTGDVSLTTA